MISTWDSPAASTISVVLAVRCATSIRAKKKVLPPVSPSVAQSPRHCQTAGQVALKIAICVISNHAVSKPDRIATFTNPASLHALSFSKDGTLAFRGIHIHTHRAGDDEVRLFFGAQLQHLTLSRRQFPPGQSQIAVRPDAGEPRYHIGDRRFLFQLSPLFQVQQTYLGTSAPFLIIFILLAN